MPLTLPNLDQRNFEQLLAELKRRIPAHTREWTTFDVEGDPGVTLLQLFAHLTDMLLYQANRIPERNRLKFLTLLGVGLQPAAAAEGLVTIANDHAPLAPLPLAAGVPLAAGKVPFMTRDGVNVLPVDAQAFVKRPVPDNDPRYGDFLADHNAWLLASDKASGGQLAFYETVPLALPSAADPRPRLDLDADTQDRAVYLALLARPNVALDTVRQALAGQTLSLGVVPALDAVPAALLPRRPAEGVAPPLGLVYELSNADPDGGPWIRLQPTQEPDVLNGVGIVQLPLPGGTNLTDLAYRTFSDPTDEGAGDFPPRIEDDALRARLVTWLRIRLPQPPGTAQESAGRARLTWVGINAARVGQALRVDGEAAGSGNGEPDQVLRLANAPLLAGSIALESRQSDGSARAWRRVDDLLAAAADDAVFALDCEAATLTFGDGLRGARPALGERFTARYEYGGGPAGNVAIGAIKVSADPRLAGSFRISNPLPTWGGDNGESAAEGERRIPLWLRHRDRLVTADDFRDIAQTTPGIDIGRVEVIPLFRPTKPPADNEPGVVTLLAIPRSDARDPLWPGPDRLFLTRLCEHLDSRRLVTTEVFVRGPDYLDIYLSVGIAIRPGHFPDSVRQAVQKRLRDYLSALPPGGPDETGWPLRRRLLRKEFEAVVARVAGVDYLDALQMGVGNLSDVAEYPLAGLQLPRVAGLRVALGDSEALAQAFSPPATPNDATPVVPVPVSRSIC